MRVGRDRADQRSPHQAAAAAGAQPSPDRSCARVARRSRRRRRWDGPARPAQPLSRRRRLRRERARPCERHRRLVPQRGRPPRLRESSRRARPDRQRSGGGSHRRHRVRPGQRRECERWHHAVARLSEPLPRTRRGRAQHSRLPMLPRDGDQLRSVTGKTACQHLRIPSGTRSRRRWLTRVRRVPRGAGGRTPRAAPDIRSLPRRSPHGDWETRPPPFQAAGRRRQRCAQ